MAKRSLAMPFHDTLMTHRVPGYGAAVPRVSLSPKG